MRVEYINQFSYETTEYDIDHEKEIIRLTLNGTEEIFHDLSSISEHEENRNEEGEDIIHPFPIHEAKRINGELHVKVYNYYR
ncbi:hypothetical protein [Halalkalibacter krulwichiae]|uniref:hypothetical protein n=1 Tax=Halalkalibacter krulwichiae TaxID=199441 RepID=UPI000824751D|nr:hypothetical protein [Halalkalibacter krulwichiae]